MIIALITIGIIITIMSVITVISCCVVGGRKEREYYEYKERCCPTCNKPLMAKVVSSNDTYEKLYLHCPTCDYHKEKIVKKEGK